MPKAISRTGSRALTQAARVLEIYANGGGFREAVAELGMLRDAEGRKTNAETLLEWAIGVFMSDEAKRNSAARLMADLENLREARVTDFLAFNADGVRLKDSEDIHRDALAAVSEVKQNKDGISLKTVDRLRVLEIIGRINGAITSNVKLEGKIDHTHHLADRLDEAVKRVSAPVIDVTPDGPTD